MTSWRPGPGKDLVQSPSALARDVPASQLSVPYWGQSGKNLSVGGWHCLRPLQSASQALLLALTVPSALPPGETPGCDARAQGAQG